MTLHEAIGDVGCLGGEFERRLALREVLRQMYEEEERQKWNDEKEAITLQKPELPVRKKKKLPRQPSFENRYFDFIVYATVHHGNLVSVLLFLPVILMVCYIVFIERSPLFT